MLLTVDASTLVGEPLRRRGQALLSSPEIELYVPSRMWEEAEHELGRRLRIMVSQGRAEAAVAERDENARVSIFSERIHAGGSTTLNRGQAAHATSISHFGRLPRHLGISAGGTGKLNSSSTDQR